MLGAVRNADRMNQRRVRVLPRIVPQASIGDLRRSRRGEYAAKPHLPRLEIRKGQKPHQRKPDIPQTKKYLDGFTENSVSFNNL